MASTAPIAKANILGLLQADSNLAGVEIKYAWPDDPSQECLAFGKTTQTESFPTMGNGRKREDYTLEMIVEVAQDGGESTDAAQAAEERCWVIVGRIEALFSPVGSKGRLTFNSVDGVNLWANFAGAEMIPYPLGSQRVAQALVQIECRADK